MPRLIERSRPDREARRTARLAAEQDLMRRRVVAVLVGDHDLAAALRRRRLAMDVGA